MKVIVIIFPEVAITRFNSLGIVLYFQKVGLVYDKRIIFAAYESDFAARWGALARDLLLEHGRLFKVQINPESSSAARWDIAERGWTTLPRNKFGQLVGDVVTREHGLTVRHDVRDSGGKSQRGWRGLALRDNSASIEDKRLTFDDPERQAAWDLSK